MNVVIIGTKHNVQCLDCGNRWGVYLNEKGELPKGWNICLKCAHKFLDVKKDVEKDERVRTVS